MTVHEKSFHAMGTDMHLLIESETISNRTLDMVPVWFEEWEQIFSRFRTASELSRLNRSNGSIFHVSSSMNEVIKLAMEIEQRTEGVVTPIISDALVRAGYDRSFDDIQKEMNDVYQLSTPVYGIESVEYDPDQSTIRLHDGVHLDLGGIVKGWAADQIVTRLKGEGPILMDCGGDIGIRGQLSDGSGWLVGIEDPGFRGRDIFSVELSELSIATSGINRRNWMRGRSSMHHLIDPRTWQPSRSNVITTTVIAESVVEAEMAAKVAVIRGSEFAADWMQRQGRFQQISFHQDGRISFSGNLVEVKVYQE